MNTIELDINGVIVPVTIDIVDTTDDKIIADVTLEEEHEHLREYVHEAVDELIIGALTTAVENPDFYKDIIS